MIEQIVEALENLSARIKAVEVRERAELSNAVPAVTFANLPAAGQAGRWRFVTDGRKTGEGAGLGTGVMAYDDGSGWFRPADDTAVAV